MESTGRGVAPERYDAPSCDRNEFIEATKCVTVLAPSCDGDITPPAVPTGLTATPGDRSVALNWNDNSDVVDHYNVYRGTTAVATGITSDYIDTGLTNGTNYCYTVTAEDAANNESQPSNQACATPSAPARVVHVADLDRAASRKGKSANWEASVTVTVRDAADAAVAGATVSGSWSGGISASASAVTASNGTLTLRTGSKVQGTTVTFTVANVTGAGLTDNAAANIDPDGDSTGTSITSRDRRRGGCAKRTLRFTLPLLVR
jgi:hypothetical protein